MKGRWMGAALAALLLAAVTIPALRENHADAEGICEANPKAANLGFTLKDMAGKDVNLAAYKGKVIVLDFWATWCGPCKFEIPGFVQLQEKYGKDGLQVIGVSVDDTVEQLQPFVALYRMNYPVLQGLKHEEVQEAFGPMWGIPTSVIISRDGRICAKHTGLPPTRSSEGSLEQRVKEEFEQQIKALLGPASTSPRVI